LKNRNTFKSFEELQRYYQNRRISPNLPKALPKVQCEKALESTAADDLQCFHEAMRDVIPLPPGIRREVSRPLASKPYIDPGGEPETAAALLEALVNNGTGFRVSCTSEYMEGTGYRIHPGMLRRLHRGDYAVQSHIDLHGLGVAIAKEKLDQFLKDAVQLGKRQVLIIHGRGLSSPAEPILKTRVREWLTTGPWRKWIIAYTSARICDGGAGATYVLLRRQPITNRFKKNKYKI